MRAGVPLNEGVGGRSGTGVGGTAPWREEPGGLEAAEHGGDLEGLGQHVELEHLVGHPLDAHPVDIRRDGQRVGFDRHDGGDGGRNRKGGGQLLHRLLYGGPAAVGDLLALPERVEERRQRLRVLRSAVIG